jgi:hypothetical protein
MITFHKIKISLSSILFTYFSLISFKNQDNGHDSFVSTYGMALFSGGKKLVVSARYCTGFLKLLAPAPTTASNCEHNFVFIEKSFTFWYSFVQNQQ